MAYDVEYGPFQVNYIEEVDQMAMIKQQVMTAEFQYMTAIIIQTRIRISILITTVLGEQSKCDIGKRRKHQHCDIGYWSLK